MLMMLPFEAPTIFEGIHKSYFRMPRVVKDQKNKFENDDLFRQLSHESAVKYTGFKDRPIEERQMKFIADCQAGHTEVSVVQSGNQFTLIFNPSKNPAYENEGCDFDKELGKVHIKSGFILNGVCVRWRGWVDLQRLEGFGCLEFDTYQAYLEDAMLKQQIDKQRACNNSTIPTSMNHQTSPLGRLSHPNPLGGSHLAAAAAAAAAANSLPPVGLNPACLGGPPGPHGGLQGAPPGLGPPPSSILGDASHYGNAAIAAAAAAAFHQALSVGGPQLQPGSTLHGLGGSQQLGPLTGPGQGLSLGYTNGSLANGSPSMPIPPLTRTSPSNSSSNNANSHRSSRSPERISPNHQRMALKRAPDEQTHTDDVDVVSDMNAHDLDFPPRRMFKSEGITTAAHHHQHRATRRA